MVPTIKMERAMESHSQETLRRVQENDNILTELVIGMRGFVHGSCPHGG